ACEPGGCSAPVAGYSACLTSFTSSIRFSLHAYGKSDENAQPFLHALIAQTDKTVPAEGN
ncbi:MAG: hypothetical protein E7K62_20330, partial [Escherichia coli]|nr:hypothetical protein [Escherichia coli]MDU7542144.1 hypothetical protein [Escherichia coli]